MNNIDNPLSGYQSPPKEALINFGIDVSKEILFHVREGAKEVSEQEILYMLDMKVGG